MSLEELRNVLSPNLCVSDVEKMVRNASDLEDISIGTIKITPSSQKIGDSYLSEIIRFTINASGTERSCRDAVLQVNINVIAKTLPKNLGRRKTFRSKDFFENEVIFYDKVWSSLRKFCESKDTQFDFGEMFTGIVPKFLAYELGGNYDYICLEDLSYKEYKNIERGTGIDHSHTMRVMDLFAKFHSISLAYKDQNPKGFQDIASCLKETYFSEKFYGWYGKLQESLFDLVRDAVQKELPTHYYDKIDKIFKNDFFRKTCKICEFPISHLSGITHGDAWLPNFLFCGDASVALIDFQLSRWAPFSNDLTFFMLTCVEENVLMKSWDEFLNEYVKKMQYYLKLLGSPPDLITINDLQEDIKRFSVFTVAMAIEALPMSLIDGFDLNKIQGDEVIPLESIWVMKPFQDEVPRRRVANMIKLLVDKEII